MLFHLDYQYDGNGKARVTLCSREQLNTLFAQCGNFVLQPLKLNDMEVPAHFSKGGIEDVAIETSNLLMEEKFASTVEGVWIYTLLTNYTKGLNRSINNNIQTFQ